MLSEISQSKEDNQMISQMWNLRNKTDEHVGGVERERQTIRLLTLESKLMVTGGVGGMGEIGDGD